MPARRLPPPVPGPPAADAPALSVVVPCFDCADAVEDSLALLRTHLEGLGITWEIVLVDDGSADDTGSVVETLADGVKVRAARLPVNRGKGRAVATGMAMARGRCRLFTDADLPYRLDAVAGALDRVLAGHPAVFGNRRLAGSDARAASAVRRWASGLVRRVVGWALGRSDLDTQCGFKAFSGPLAEAVFPLLRVDGFLFDVELCLLLTQAGVEIEAVPVTLINQDTSTVHVLGTGLDTLAESWRLWRIRRRRAGDLEMLRAAASVPVAPPGGDRRVAAEGS